MFLKEFPNQPETLFKRSRLAWLRGKIFDVDSEYDVPLKAAPRIHTFDVVVRFSVGFRNKKLPFFFFQFSNKRKDLIKLELFSLVRI